MDWKENINRLDLADSSTHFEFNNPASENIFQNLQSQLDLIELPSELEDLYKQSNGISRHFKGQKIGELIWTAEEVIEVNKEYRSDPQYKELYMSFNQLLFISDAGNGDLFGFVSLNGKFDRSDIFVWNHENDSRIWIAPNLTKFMEYYANETIYS